MMNEQSQGSYELSDRSGQRLATLELKGRPESLEDISLRELREKNKQTEQAINLVKSRINYMKTREEKTIKKVVNVRRKLTSLEEVRKKARQSKQLSIEEKQRYEENLARKAEFNKLIKEHLKYNKKIVMTLVNHKVHEEVRGFKEKQQQYSLLGHIQRDSANEDAAEKANKVRSGHVEAQEKRKMYFLDKLKQFKDFKEKKLSEEIRERERQQSLIMELQEKQRALLERLSVSEKFRIKCQEEYESARKKYRSFYEAARGVEQDESQYGQGSKANIFIS